MTPRKGTEALKSISGKKIHFSYSTASTHKGCRRRLWRQKRFDVREDGTQANIEGTEIHFILEQYWKQGIWLAPGVYSDDKEDIRVTSNGLRRAKQSLSVLPPVTWGTAEIWAEKVRVAEHMGKHIDFVGAIDLHGMLEKEAHTRWLPEHLRHFRGLAVIDHKTKKWWDGKYGPLSEEQLFRDVQIRLYARSLATTLGLEGQDVLVAHNSIRRVGNPASKLTATIIPWSEIEATWLAQRPTGERIIEDMLTETESDVPADTSYCRSFGRVCPFKSTCSAATGNKPRGMFSALAQFDKKTTDKVKATEPQEKKSMGFMDRAKAAEAATQPKVEETKTKVEETKTKVEETKVEVEETKVEADVPKPGQLQASDVSPIDNDTVTDNFLMNVVDVCNQLEEKTREAVSEAVKGEGLSVDWTDNVLILMDSDLVSEEFQPMAGDRDLILSTPCPMIFKFEAGTDEERAWAAANVPSSLFWARAPSTPAHILAKAQGEANPDRAADLRQHLMDREDWVTPYDSATEDNPEGEIPALRMLWTMAVGGEEIVVDTVSKVMKALNAWSRLNRKRANQIIEQLESEGFLTVGEAPAPQATPTPTPTSSGSVLYIGCYTEGAKHISEVPELQALGEQVNARLKAALDAKDRVFAKWQLFSDFGDTGAKRLGVLYQDHVAQNGLPPGEFWMERNSEYRGALLEQTYRSAGGKVVQARG